MRSGKTRASNPIKPPRSQESRPGRKTANEGPGKQLSAQPEETVNRDNQDRRGKGGMTMPITMLSALAVGLGGALVLMRYEPPPALSATRALILLLMCAALFLVSLCALRDPLTWREAWTGIVVTLMGLAGLIVVIVDEIRKEDA